MPRARITRLAARLLNTWPFARLAAIALAVYGGLVPPAERDGYGLGILYGLALLWLTLTGAWYAAHRQHRRTA